MNAKKLINGITAGMILLCVIAVVLIIAVGVLLAMVSCTTGTNAYSSTAKAAKAVVVSYSSDDKDDDTNSLPLDVTEMSVNQFELPDISGDGVIIDGVLTKDGGVNEYNGRTECWYSQKTVPNEDLDIPGRTVDKYGLVRDERNFLVLASGDYPYGTIVQTSLGVGKVYDVQCASGIVNIYTDW